MITKEQLRAAIEKIDWFTVKTNQKTGETFYRAGWQDLGDIAKVLIGLNPETEDSDLSEAQEREYKNLWNELDSDRCPWDFIDADDTYGNPEFYLSVKA